MHVQSNSLWSSQYMPNQCKLLLPQAAASVPFCLFWAKAQAGALPIRYRRKGTSIYRLYLYAEGKKKITRSIRLFCSPCVGFDHRLFLVQQYSIMFLVPLLYRIADRSDWPAHLVQRFCLPSAISVEQGNKWRRHIYFLPLHSRFFFPLVIGMRSNELGWVGWFNWVIALCIKHPYDLVFCLC